MSGAARDRSTSHQIDHLFRHPEHLELVADWIHREFWTRSGRGVEFVAALLRQAVDPDCIPLSRLALVEGRPAGIVNLIACDSTARPDLTPWLAALLVAPQFRGKGIGSALVGDLAKEAARIGCAELFLETDIPPFYERSGARIHQPLPEGGWIMRMELKA